MDVCWPKKFGHLHTHLNRSTMNLMGLLEPTHLCHRLLKRFYSPSSSSYAISFSRSQKNKKGTSSLETYNCNFKITALGRKHRVKDAQKLFDEMSEPDIISYAAMINIYIKNGYLQKAEKLFHEMPETNVVVESAMIDGYAKAGRIDDAHRIFDKMPVRNVFSWTSLVSGYIRMGKIEEARFLFDRMPMKNNFTWTTMILGYARNGLISEARKLFDVMPDKNVVSWTAMTKVYAEYGMLNEAQELFDAMPQRNIFSWNIMIFAYLENKLIGQAIKMFEMMPQKNAVSWTTMVAGLAREGWMDSAREFFDQMPEKDIAAWNAMIAAYAGGGLMVEASELFSLMSERSIVTWNVLIDGYAKCGHGLECLKHLALMLWTSEKPNETTFTSILTACGSAIEVTQVHALILSLGLDSDTLLTNALITAYSRAGDIAASHRAFMKLAAKDSVSWTAMILAFSNHGCGDHAMEVFASMLRAGAKPDEIAFVGVLSACSHGGLLLKGQRLFSSMKQAYGLVPRAEHYACLIDLLGRAGRIEEAESVMNQMPRGEIDGAVLGALLAACNLHSDEEVAARVAEGLIEAMPDVSGPYVLLANLYAGRRKWDDVSRIRKMMKERKVKKVPGFSQIEVKNTSHLFFVGDREHPETWKIYTMLDTLLLPQMKEMGYFQRTAPSI